MYLCVSSANSKKQKIQKTPLTRNCYSIDIFSHNMTSFLFISSFSHLSLSLPSSLPLSLFLEIEKSLQMLDKRSFLLFKLKNHHDCCSLHLLMYITSSHFPIISKTQTPKQTGENRETKKKRQMKKGNFLEKSKMYLKLAFGGKTKKNLINDNVSTLVNGTNRTKWRRG